MAGCRQCRAGGNGPFLTLVHVVANVSFSCVHLDLTGSSLDYSEEIEAGIGSGNAHRVVLAVVRRAFRASRLDEVDLALHGDILPCQLLHVVVPVPRIPVRALEDLRDEVT